MCFLAIFLLVPVALLAGEDVGVGVVASGKGIAQVPISAQVTSKKDSVAVVMLPLANHTGRTEALELAGRLIMESLDSLGVVYLDPQSIRPILRQGRIRAIGRIDLRGACALREMTGTKWLLLGSVDVFRKSNPPEFGLSLRLLDAKSLWVRAAVSRGHSGRDFEGVFGSGQHHELIDVAHKAVDEAISELLEMLSRPSQKDGGAPAGPRCCVIPFDGTPRSWRDGNAVSNLMLSSLVGAGYRVLEPGVVREYLLSRAKAFKGEIDLSSLAVLAEEESISYAITGTVESFEPARGGSAGAVPSVSLSARVINARSGRLLDAWYDERTGRDGESLFQRGRTYSLTALMLDSLKRFVKRIEKVRELDEEDL